MVASAGSARKEALERKYQDCSIMKKVFLPIGNGGGCMVARLLFHGVLRCCIVIYQYTISFFSKFSECNNLLVGFCCLCFLSFFLLSVWIFLTICLLLFFQLYLNQCYCIWYHIVNFFMECPDSYMGIGSIGTLACFAIIFNFFHHIWISFFPTYLKINEWVHVAYYDPW